MEKGNLKMKKRILVTMVALMTSIVAIGCSSNTQQQEPKETTSNEKQLEEVSHPFYFTIRNDNSRFVVFAVVETTVYYIQSDVFSDFTF